MKNTFLLLIIAIACYGCAEKSPTEKHQGKRNNIINVKDRIKEIEIRDVLINKYPQLYILNGYLLIADNRSFDEQIHLFDKNSFSYITSTAPKGEAPGYIVQLWCVATDEAHRKFQVNDTGRRRIFSYDLDSVLAANPDYLPEVKMNTDSITLPTVYQYFNDTLSIGVMMEPTSSSTFNLLTARFNMQTGVMEKMKYEHPEIKKKRVSVEASPEHGIYVEVYWHHDLFTICSLDGELKYNVYGRKWDTKMSIRKNYFRKVKMYNDKFIAEYFDGGDNFYQDKATGEIKGTNPTQLIIFDLQGNYIATLDTGYDIMNFCCDEENNRLIFSFDDDMQFGYLSLDGLVD